MIRTKEYLAMDLATLTSTRWASLPEEINRLTLKEMAQEVIQRATDAGKSIQDGVTAEVIIAETLKTYSR